MTKCKGINAKSKLSYLCWFSGNIVITVSTAHGSVLCKTLNLLINLQMLMQVHNVGILKS